MPSPGTPVDPRPSAASSFLDLIVETVETLDHSARAHFLQKFFRSLTHLELSEDRSLELWEEVLTRQQALAGSAGQLVSFQTAVVDVFTTSDLFRVPVLIERSELKKLELNAVTDPLTGLHNRRLFQETFQKELNRAKRYAQPLSLVMLDLHRFKEVNDQHGHPRGDEVLRAAAATLRKSLRTSDAAFRIGGDEFAMMLPQTDAVQALSLSKRIGVVFAEILQSLQLGMDVTMDHGVATYPMDGEHSDQLVRIADERLYRSKHGNHGKSAVSVELPETADAPAASAPVPARPETVVSPPSPQPAEVAKPPEPISIETKRPVQPAESSLSAAVSASAASSAPAAAPLPIESRAIYAIQRKAERVSMSGTNAYAVLGESANRRAKVLDLGFGGVALELDAAQDLPDNLLAILHVPILPPVRVNLKPVWSRSTAQGSFRVGCCFIS
jgi:diguanylate cyclase (GGDEF)-like protein